MKHKILSLLLALCMALSLMPATVFVADATSYDVWVGGTQVTAENADDVLDDGTVSYDPTASTMTLNGADITGAVTSSNVSLYGNYGILAKNNLTIQLLGDNSVTAGEASSGSYGITAYDGKLTICGSGTLTAKGGTASSEGTTSWGIGASEIVISSGRITAVGGAGRNSSFGLYAWTNGITIKGGSVTAIGGTCDGNNFNSYGIYHGAGAQKIDITGGSGTASGLYAAMSVSPTLSGNVKVAEGSYNGSSFKWAPVNAMEVDLDGEGGNGPVLYESFVEGWNAAINNNTANTTVKLLADWTADENGYFSSVSSDGFHNGAGTAGGYTGSIRIPSGKTIALNLNGHTIDRNLKSSKANGYAIVVNGTLTLQDSVGTGTITGGYDSEVGGVSVYGGTFTMEGGSISGNHGAGVYVLRSGSNFTMKGGKIQNNDKYGVYFQNGTMTLFGAPVISGNTAGGSDAGNLYLSSGNSVTIGMDGLNAGADIGISFGTWPTENNSNTVATGSNGTYAGYFRSDKTGYETYNDGETVKLRKASEEQKYTVTYDANGGGNAPADAQYPYNTNGTFIVPADMPTHPDGKVFRGWVDSDAPEDLRRPGDEVPLYSGNPNRRTITMVAQWGDPNLSITTGSGTIYYTCLEDAFLYAPDGSTVLVEKDYIDGSSAILYIEDEKEPRTLTLDLNGKTINSDGDCGIGIYDEGLTITGNGTYNGFIQQNGGSLTIENGSFGMLVVTDFYPGRTTSLKGGTFTGMEDTDDLLNKKGILYIAEGSTDEAAAKTAINGLTAAGKQYSSNALFTGTDGEGNNAYACAYFSGSVSVVPDIPTYTVTYNANGATSGSVPTDSTAYAPGTSVTVLANSGNLQKTCGTFAGWNTTADGSGDSYAAGGAFSIFADTILYAQWTEAHTFDADGFCKATEGETHFQPAVLNGDIYEISNTGQLYWFAETVNSGDKAINGKLTKDIDLSVSQTIPWVPIGQNDVYYSGSFNGGGHTVSNLYINNTADYQGFFGRFDGTLISLTVTGEIHSGRYTGGICGNMGINGSISNCTNAADILCTGNWIGGIVGYNYGEISNCRNLADIQGASKVGGICGFNNQAKDWDTEPPAVTSWGTIKNCYNTGAVTSTAGPEAGGICGASTPAKGTALFNNYCIDSVTYGCFWSTDHVKGFLKGAVESKTAEQFASGEVAYLLNSGKTDGSQVWLQTIGTDSLPQFTGATVYQVEQYDCPADTTAAIAYSNTDSDIRGTEHAVTRHNAVDATCQSAGNIEYWYCKACGKYFSDEECTTEITLDETVIPAAHGETEIKNAKEATCTEEGYTGDKVCKDCGKVVEKGEPIVKITHPYKDGKCTVCGAADPDCKPDTKPTEPSEPTKPEENKPGDAPQTGDTSNIALWIVLMIAAGAGVTGTAVYSRKRKKQAK